MNGEEQRKEIETISERTLVLKLSDADCKRIAEKAGAVGLTVAQLLENFIGDLVDGTYSNGSDERMYADEWFNRCGFAAFPERTFLRWLIKEDFLDNVLGLWNDIQQAKEELADGDSVADGWEPGVREEILEDIECWQKEIEKYWGDYNFSPRFGNESFEEEMKKTLDWQNKQYEFLTGVKLPESQK